VRLGAVSLLGPDDPTARVAVPASWGWLPAAIALAFAVPGWRRRPLTATPALLAVLPWLPVALPSVALVWTGRLAWLPILLAALASFQGTSRPVSEPTDGPPVGPAAKPVLGSMALAAGCTMLVAVFAAWSLAARVPGGDEPHYLIITQSLLKDGDLQIENNHDARDFAEYFAGDAPPDFKIRGQNGAIYSIHAPGTSIVVLPAFAAFGYRGAQATVVLLAALASALMWYAAWLATADRQSAWIAWLAVAGTPTFVIQSVTIFPDSVGMFVVAVGVIGLLRLSKAGLSLSAAGLVGLSALIALLPWLHTRFSVLAAGLGLCVAWLLAADADRPAPQRWRRLGLFFAIPLVSAVAWFAYFHIVYGTPNPVFPYGEDRGTRLAYMPGGLLGLLLDAQFGLLAYSPVLAAAFVGMFAPAGQRTRAVARAIGLVGMVYLAAAATYWMWWAGVPASPARFAAAILPVFVIPIALAWRSASAMTRALWATLLNVSIAGTVVVIAGDRARIAWNTRGVRANWLDWLSGLADLSRAWPSFFWQLDPADLTSEWHFFGHALLWTVVFVGSGLLVVRFGRRRRTIEAGITWPVASWWFALALMLAIQTGWWFNGSNGLNAASSQIAVLNAASNGERVMQIRPFAFAPLRQVEREMRIRATRADEVGEAAATWVPMLELPPGDYALTASLRRPRPGMLSVRIGRSLEPLRRLRLHGVTEQTLPLALPAGAGALFFEPDAALAGAGDRLELVPLKLSARVAADAVTSARFNDVDVFFHGPSVYVEPEDFWVRGGHTADFTLAAERGRQTVALELINGEAANDLAIDLGTRQWRLRLEATESRTIQVALTREGTALVRLTSPAGFRPSDDGTNEDRRYLGVRVRVLK
jgi:hypothetical protein